MKFLLFTFLNDSDYYENSDFISDNIDYNNQLDSSSNSRKLFIDYYLFDSNLKCINIFLKNEQLLATETKKELKLIKFIYYETLKLNQVGATAYWLQTIDCTNNNNNNFSIDNNQNDYNDQKFPDRDNNFTERYPTNYYDRNIVIQNESYLSTKIIAFVCAIILFFGLFCIFFIIYIKFNRKYNRMRKGHDCKNRVKRRVRKRNLGSNNNNRRATTTTSTTSFYFDPFRIISNERRLDLIKKTDECETACTR